MEKRMGWFSGGLALGAVFLIAAVLVKPIGVSTQYVILDGIVWNVFSDQLIQQDASAKHGYTSSNAYLNKSGGKYASHVANPLNYGFVFVLAMVLGGFISARLQKLKLPEQERSAPLVWRQAFGDSKRKRYLFTFLGGVLLLYGARLAGGCTSGHMMSGMMQTSLSGYLFALGTFGSGIPLAIYLFKKSDHKGN